MNIVEDGTAVDGAALHFLQLSARLLLEYNVRSRTLERRTESLARHLGVNAQTAAGYREVTLVTPDGRSFYAQTHELRINVAVRAATEHVIDELLKGRLELGEATRQLETLERATPRHRRWVVATLFALAAAAIAWLLRADWGAIVVSGASSGVGLIVRQEIAKRSVILFAQPFAGGLVGAVLGGVAIRLGWTTTPGFCLIVPALMLVPGPHLINAAYDMFENHVQTGVCRLVLSLGILGATALGVVLGGWLVLGPAVLSTAPSADMHLTLLLDVALAGIAACGFGTFYNAPWRFLWVSIVCGMAGHGVRYLSLEHMGIEISTLFASLTIGIIAAAAADRLRLPFSSIAFAGAVPMMPGVFIYQSFGGAMRLSAAGAAADPALVAATLALFLKSVFVVGAMALGLLVGARLPGLARRHG